MSRWPGGVFSDWKMGKGRFSNLSSDRDFSSEIGTNDEVFPAAMNLFAHTRNNDGKWHLLTDHLVKVANKASQNAALFRGGGSCVLDRPLA